MYWLQPWQRSMIIQNQQERNLSRGDQQEQEHHFPLRNDGSRRPIDQWIDAREFSKGDDRT